MSAAELSSAYDPSCAFARIIPEGYPFLTVAGAELRAADVDFFDLTLVFRDRSETLYCDTCCHVNSDGSELVAMRLAETLCEVLSSRG